ncbi:uncharacterized protein LOC131975195 [Centropristis striata]|uniref:uncharacterized protein LOC131975195 n=1 Tax=Centropristis striata TaxID=184440 RepID=UPI0027E09E8B|nr:uncharacterized protein LOC131975195 [Centropristis striata]
MLLFSSRCNPTGIRRTWLQVKMKHKNIIQTANRRKAEARKTRAGPPPPLADVEELDLSHNTGTPVAEGISSSEPGTPQDTGADIKFFDGVLHIVEPPASIELKVEEDSDSKEVLSAATEMERPTESMAGHHQEQAPSTPAAQLDTLPVKELHRLHLVKKITKMDQEMVYVGRQIRKIDLEIELLQHQLEEIKKNK